MKELSYKDFSLKAHDNNSEKNKINFCQFELTYACAYHCTYCYSDCYNKPEFIRNELTTKEVKQVLDEVQRAGVAWLSLSGGDPLARKDFPEIYAYAKKKGFIISVLTNGYSMTEEIFRLFKNSPPFVIEVTLNSIDRPVYEKITKVKGSLNKVIDWLSRMTHDGLPVKLKSMATRENKDSLRLTKKVLRLEGTPTTVNYLIYPRLNGDCSPCSLRLTPEEIFGKKNKPADESCRAMQRTGVNNEEIFDCAVVYSDGFSIDPYGNLFLCDLIRDTKVNILGRNLMQAFDIQQDYFQVVIFGKNAKCNGCLLRKYCAWCPGKAHLEKKNMQAYIDYYCELAKMEKYAAKE